MNDELRKAIEKVILKEKRKRHLKNKSITTDA